MQKSERWVIFMSAAMGVARHQDAAVFADKAEEEYIKRFPEYVELPHPVSAWSDRLQSNVSESDCTCEVHEGALCPWHHRGSEFR